jgi:hypothetical protein
MLERNAAFRKRGQRSIIVMTADWFLCRARRRRTAGPRREFVQTVGRGHFFEWPSRIALSVMLSKPIEVVKPFLAVDGGLSRSPYFSQFLADGLGRDVITRPFDESTSLGCASLAALAIDTELPVSSAATSRTVPATSTDRRGAGVSIRR